MKSSGSLSLILALASQSRPRRTLALDPGFCAKVYTRIQLVRTERELSLDFLRVNRAASFARAVWWLPRGLAAAFSGKLSFGFEDQVGRLDDCVRIERD
jgi:hypothetical protein